MAKKKVVDDPNVRKRANRGRNSIGLTLPMEVVKGLKWKAGKKVMVKVEKGNVVISEWKLARR